LRAAKSARIKWVVPDTKGLPVAQLGVQIDPPKAGTAAGIVEVDWLTWSGSPEINFSLGDALTPGGRSGAFLGWILNCGTTHRDAWGPNATAAHLVSNRGVGLMHTGTADWADYAVSGQIAVRLADRAGLVARYGGLNRYIALVFNRVARELQIVRQYDDITQLLAKTGCEWQCNEVHDLRLEVKGNTAAGYADAKSGSPPVLEAQFEGLSAGGIACLTDNGTTSFARIAVTNVE
jgi:hypothetical protein